MLRHATALLLIGSLLLPLPPASAQASVKEQAVTISRGNAVEVRLLDGSKLRGWMGVVTDSGFELEARKGGKQQIAFGQVKSLRDMKKKSFGRSLGTGYLIGLIVIAVIGVTVAIVCHDACTG